MRNLSAPRTVATTHRITKLMSSRVKNRAEISKRSRSRRGMKANASDSAESPSVCLTVAENTKDNSAITVRTSKLIAYQQHTGFTRLILTTGQVLDVAERTDQIDRLVRLAR